MTLMKSKFYVPGPLEQAICLKVKSGSSMSKVALQLGDQGAITSTQLFNIGVDYTNRASDLKAGNFLIRAGASMAEIADQITTSGRNTCGTEVIYRVGVTRTTVLVRELDPMTNAYVEVARFNPAEEVAPDVYSQSLAVNDTRMRVTVAEGATSWQIVEGLKAIDALGGNVPELPSEGSLAPDSYEIRVGDLRTDILQLMLKAQEVLLAEVWASRNDKTPVDSKEELLVLASIIEKETSVAGERDMVASVFANRLNSGMRLQTDPTVIYGITLGKGPLGRRLLKKDTLRDTVWNTYTNFGLPPSPIANPGLASLQAAINPAETDYKYFVADGMGGHAFAETNKEHNRNRVALKKIIADQNK